MTWRDEARFFISPPSSPLFDSKVRWIHHKTTPAAPSASVARLLPARFTTAPHPTVPTPSDSRPSRPLRAVVVSVRDGSPFWCAPSSHRKYKNHPNIYPASVLLSPLPFIHRPSSPNLPSVITLCGSMPVSKGAGAAAKGGGAPPRIRPRDNRGHGCSGMLPRT